MLKAEKLTKNYGEERGIENISFSLKAGEIMGVIGANGSGKTTLFKCLLRLVDPDSGKLSWNKKPLEETDSSLFGYMPEERSLYADVTVYEQLLFFCRLRRIPREQIEERIRFWLQRLDMPDAEEKRIRELSKGNQQKIQLICALIHDPEVLVLDEPLSGLDVFNEEIFKSIIRDLKKQKKTVLLSSHQFEYAEDLFDRVLCLDKGRISLAGEVQKLKRTEKRRYIELISPKRKDFYLLDGVTGQNVSGDKIRLEIEDEEKARGIFLQLMEEQELISMTLELPTLKDILAERTDA